MTEAVDKKQSLFVKKLFKDYRIPLLAVVVFIVVSIIRPRFVSAYNLFTLFDAIPGYGIAAVGLTFVMLCGQLDISIGSVMALSSCVFMMMLKNGSPFVLAMFVALLIGACCGTVTGFFISTFRLSPFIVSMTMQLICKGIALTITHSTPVAYQHPTLVSISRMKLGPIPITMLLFLLVVFIAYFVMRKTQYGRNLYVIGGNINVADNLGLNVRMHLWSIFIIQGFCSALGGLCLMTRQFSASGNLAIDGIMTIIPMVIVGGTVFSGGKGDSIKTLYGAVLMEIIYNAMAMFNMGANMQKMLRGLILLIIIVSDKYIENRKYKV